MSMEQPENGIHADPDKNLHVSLGRDLTDPRWMLVKAAGFVIIGMAACGLILLAAPRWDIAAFLALAIWAFARAYYFAFYVIEHYVDPGYSYDGLISAIGHLRKIRKDTIRNGTERSRTTPNRLE